MALTGRLRNAMTIVPPNLEARMSIVLTLVCALAACNGSKPTERPSPTAVGSTTTMPPNEPRPTPSVPSQLTAPREERTSAYAVTWSVSTEAAAKGSDERVLKLEYQVKAFEELYISDRLWNSDPVSYRVPDPFGVYRFVRDGSLRLVFAQAPKPPNVMFGNTYPPLYSRVLAGETRRQTVRIKLPVDEYSALGLARDVNAPTVVEQVSRVYFVLGVSLRSTMGGAPAPPMRESGEKDGYVVNGSKNIVLAMDVDKLPVKRRTGYMARFPLPGEPGPDPMPVNSP
jgi:hypothetical protein